MNKLTPILEKLQIVLLLAMVVLVTLYFNVTVFQAFPVPKRLIFEIFFFLWLFVSFSRIYLTGSVTWPKGRMLGGLFLGYFGVTLLSVFVSTQTGTSLFGSTLRAYGALLQLELFFLFVWLVIDYRLLQRYLVYLYYTISVVGLMISLYGLTQALGLDPLDWAKPAEVAMRVTSTVGQPNFLASTLILTLVFSVLAIVKSKKSWLKAVMSLSVLLQLVCIVLTLSRGAWLGLGVATLVFIFSYLFKKQRRFFYIGIIGLAIFIGAFLHLGSQFKYQVKGLDAWTIKDRIISLTDFKQGSIRALYYRASLDLILRQPFLGYGADMLGYYSHPYYSPAWPVYETLNQATDKAHNFFLDVWLDSGLTGILWWLFFIYFIWQLTRKGLSFERGAYLFGMLAVFISWQVSLVTLEQALLFWIVSGLYVGSSVETREVKFEQLHVALIGTLLLGIAGFGIIRDSSAYTGGQVYRQVLQSSQVDDDERLDRIIKLLETAPPADIKRYYGAQIYVQLIDMAQKDKISRDKLEKIISELDKHDGSPMTFEWQINRLIFSEIIFRDKLSLPIGAEMFDKLNGQFKELKREAPGYALVELAWGNLDYYHGDCLSANRHYQEALELYPALDNQEMNKEHRQLVEAERGQVVAQIKTCESVLKRETLLRSRPR